jgi:adenine-specific DNA-methyltransferase
MMYGARSNGKQHGVVLTKVDVVESMLNLLDYIPSKDLRLIEIVEPSAGEGAFALPIIERLHQSSVDFNFDFEKALTNIRLYEIDEDRYVQLAINIKTLLSQFGVAFPESMIILGDFLTVDILKADIVIGNPPYVRHENIPDSKKEIYRKQFGTFRHRSDLYIPFFEKGLKLLKNNGKLSYICSNRWLKNQYGEGLRRFISSQFNLLTVIDLENTNPFNESVIAYPSIVIIAKDLEKNIAKYYQLNEISELKRIPNQIKPARILNLHSSNWFFSETASEKYPSCLDTISNQGFKIGIGVATGCDRVFIRDDFEQIVEQELLLPILTSRDLKGDMLCWSGKHLLNPFTPSGELINLDNFPRANGYLNANCEALKNRHIAKKKPSNWFRTIDRIGSTLTQKAKIILPDISGNRYVFIDEGNYYPHHNLYYITGRDEISLKVLAAVLMSDFVRNQLLEIGNTMNGGYPRWQSQNLNRLRIPIINAIPKNIIEQLVAAYQEKDYLRINKLIDIEKLTEYKIYKGQTKLFVFSDL